MGRHLATFTRRPGSSLYTFATEPPRVAASAQVSTSLPLLPPSPAPPCLPCVEGRQHAAPHSSSFPPTTAPLQTLHMDVCGPARVSGQSRERYFLLVVDNYTRYTTVFPLRSKDQVVDVLIPWIRTVRLQLRERFGQDLPVLRLHSDRGGQFSSNLLIEFCRGEGILESFTLPDSPQQNGIAERRIGLVMKGSHAFVRNPFADKLSARAIACIFLGFVLDTPGWQFYHPTSRRILPSQDVTFDESVPFYRLFPYRSAPLPPPPLFLAPGPPPVHPLPPQGPAPSGVSQVDPPPGAVLGEVAVASGAARGTASWVAELGGAGPGGAEPGGAEIGGAEPGGVETGGAEPGGAEPEGVAPGGATSEGAESEGAEPQGAVSSGVELPELEVLELEVLALLMELVLLEVLRLLVREVLVPGVLELPGLVVLGVLELEILRSLELLVQAVLALVALELEELELEALAWEVLELEELELLTLVALCGRDRTSFPYFGRFLPASPLPAPSPYTEQSGGLTERREPASHLVSPVRTARRVPRSRPPPVLGTHAMTLRPSSVPLRFPLPAPPESSLPEVPDPESDRPHAASPTVSRLLATAITDPSFESAAASALVAELFYFAAACRLDYATALVAESASASPPFIRGECALDTDVLKDRQEDFECLVAAVPRFASMLLAPEGDSDAPDIQTPRSYVEAITGPYSSQWQAAMDAEMASWKSTGTYVDEVPLPGANIVDGMWIFMVKRPLGSPPAFKARYVARGFSQRQGVDYF
ncbi:unnamed protein product [Closterium sp. NIES-54]